MKRYSVQKTRQSVAYIISRYTVVDITTTAAVYWLKTDEMSICNRKKYISRLQEYASHCFRTKYCPKRDCNDRCIYFSQRLQGKVSNGILITITIKATNSRLNCYSIPVTESICGIGLLLFCLAPSFSSFAHV